MYIDVLKIESLIERARATSNYFHKLEAKGEEIPEIVDLFWFDLTQAILEYDK